MVNELGDDNRMFGGLLRDQRFAAGFTQEQLAERSGLSVRSIRNLERGRVRRPHRESIRLLASALGLSPTARDELAREGHQRPERQSGATPGAESVLPRQLPPGVPHFTGRSAALKALTDLIADNGASGQALVVSAIDGTAGVGKTALAVHWAHRVADQFPDGQLYMNLRGFDSGGPPMQSADALRQFLIALGVPAAQIPIGLEAQAAQYRSLLAGRRMLVLLDNARSAEQVRPLLPGSPGCLVLVTSRERLLSLIAAEGAHSLTLDPFTMQEGRELLARRLGAERVSHERLAVDELIQLCARLPLALNIVAARAIGGPTRPLGDLAGRLRRPVRASTC
jgi:transcriptional regulator with XRE-family HTH domain